MITISNHAMERFAERIMEKDQRWDIAYYVNQNKSIIEERINKMIEYGEKIYSGKSISEYNKSNTDVFLKDTWVIIVDPSKNKVVTLYQIDLGLGDEFNNLYVKNLSEKLLAAKEDLSKKQEELDNMKNDFQSIINQNNEIINQNNRINNELKKQNEGFQDAISGLATQFELAQQSVREIVGTMVGRKQY